MDKNPIYFDKALGWVKGTADLLVKSVLATLPITITDIPRIGFADYQDTTGDVALTDDVWTDVLNNQEGAFGITDFLPGGITSVMDPATGYLDFSELNLGDQIYVRNDFVITPTGSNALVEARYSLGSGGAAFILDIFSIQLSGAAMPVSSPKSDSRITMSFETTRIAPGKLQVRVSGGGTLVNNGSNIGITSFSPQQV